MLRLATFSPFTLQTHHFESMKSISLGMESFIIELSTIIASHLSENVPENHIVMGSRVLTRL